ncbi:MAG: hypothetical protein A2Y12_10625 [Planctomycetes bacterium GWF2_42_9]|nr:MAG: hypothetical protein A2Y12_10625 [Planctomycetes bacterium GWF2_42_9]
MNLDNKATLVENYIQSKLIDRDGIVLAMINELTGKPLNDKEIPDYMTFDNPGAPRNLWKAAFFSYEDSNMATAEYMLANIYKYKVTKDKSALIQAKKCYKAFQLIAQAGAKNCKGVVQPMLGFLPKPYGGAKTAHLSSEVSIDQYMRTMYSLLIYRDMLANKNEIKWINEFLLACANCWSMNNYTFSYFGIICRWGIHSPHSVAFGLFCSALGEYMGEKLHKNWFNIFMSRTDAFKKVMSGGEAGLINLSAKFLCKHKPELTKQWHSYSKQCIKNGFKMLDDKGHTVSPDFISCNKNNKPGWSKIPHRYWQFLSWHGDIRLPETQLAAACVDYYELTGSDMFLPAAKNLMALHMENGYAKWIQPHTKKDIPKGYELLANIVSGINTAAWLRAYWQLKYIGKL